MEWVIAALIVLLIGAFSVGYALKANREKAKKVDSLRDKLEVNDAVDRMDDAAIDAEWDKRLRDR